MAAGAPTKYKKEYCQKLIEHMKQGFSFEAFAGTIGVCEDTLFEWTRVHPEFSVSKKIAFAACRLKWEGMGMEGMLGEVMNFQSGTWIFNMKNRFKWTDRMETKEANVSGLTRKELIEQGKQILNDLEKEQNND